MPATEQNSPSVYRPNYRRGALYALVGPIVGIVAWVTVWRMGLLAAIVGYAMAWVTLWRFEAGAGPVDRKASYIVLGYVVAGLVLALMAGFASDLLDFVMQESIIAQNEGVLGILLSADFWKAYFAMITDSEFLKSQTSNILWSVVLAGAGIFQLIANLFFATKKTERDTTKA